MWVICSCRSLQKSNHERFAPVALYKRATGAICTFFAHKKWAICSKNQRAYSPPCCHYTVHIYLGSGFSHLNKCFYFVQLLSGIIFLVVYQLAHYSIVKLSVNKDSKKLFKIFAEKYSNSRRFMPNHSKLQKNSKLILHYIHRL